MVAPGLPMVASGLPVASQEFDTTKWFHSPGNSIYLKFLPQDMSKEDIRAALEFVGQISRIDIVNSPPNKLTGATYRMVFIHYDFWYSTEASMGFRGEILSVYPRPFQMWSSILQRELAVTINTRPVPKTDYNVDQLSDMFHRLQEQFTTTIQAQTKDIQELKEEVADLRRITEHNGRDFWDVKLSVDELEEKVEVNTSQLNSLNEVSNKEIAMLVNGPSQEDQEEMEYLCSSCLESKIDEACKLVADCQHEMERHVVDLAFEDARINARVKDLSQNIGHIETTVFGNTSALIDLSNRVKELEKADA
jgi:cell division protein FtsL